MIAIWPYGSTEQGNAMLSGILNSEKAILMNIVIVWTFVAILKLTRQNADVKDQIKEVKERLRGHYAQLNQIY